MSLEKVPSFRFKKYIRRKKKQEKILSLEKMRSSLIEIFMKKTFLLHQNIEYSQGCF